MDEILLHHGWLPGAHRPLSVTAAEAWLAVRKRPAGDPPGQAATLLGLALLCDCAVAMGLAPPTPANLCFPTGGKPQWRGGPDFSISHAGGRVACALAPPGTVVGLDLEPRAAVSVADLRRVAGRGELQACLDAGLDPADLWTAKEAVAKAAGAGVRGLARVGLDGFAGCLDGREYTLLRPVLAADFSCTLAASRPHGLRLQEVSAAQVLGRLDP